MRTVVSGAVRAHLVSCVLLSIACGRVASTDLDGRTDARALGSACSTYDRSRFEDAYRNPPSCSPGFGERPECVTWAKSFGFDFTLYTDCLATDGGHTCSVRWPYYSSEAAPISCPSYNLDDPTLLELHQHVPARQVRVRFSIHGCLRLRHQAREVSFVRHPARWRAHTPVLYPGDRRSEVTLHSGLRSVSHQLAKSRWWRR